jgi:predicted dehydrogenase
LARARELRAGIVGAGFAARLHAHAARVCGARVSAVAASNATRSAQAREELGAERDLATAEELVVSDAVDVVHICAPNDLHVPLALAALAAGKHVVCEKPIALDLAGAESLLAAAAASGLVVTVPFVYRYYPTVREARARMRSAGAGAPRLIHGGYLQDWLAAPGSDNWRTRAAAGGASRAFADIGSHWCDLVEFVSGERIAALTARTATVQAERGEAVDTEDVATMLFETAGGAPGSLVVSQVSAGRKNRLFFEITTESETLAFDQEQPDQLAALRLPAAETVQRGADTLSPEAAAYVTVPAGHPQGYQDCFNAFAAETYAAIAGGGRAEGLPGLEDGLRAVRLTEAVLRSASTRAWVEVPAA